MNKVLIALLLSAVIPQFAYGALKPGDTAPLFSLPDAAGGNFALKRFSGQAGNANTKGIVLSFFASWCVPCREELPLINSLSDDLAAKGIRTVLIGVRENFDTIRRLLAALRVDRPIVLCDGDGTVSGLYQVRFLPATFFIGSDGKVKDVIFGQISSADELRKSAEKLLP